MKRFVSVLLFLALTLSVLASCASGDTPAQTTADAPLTDPPQVETEPAETTRTLYKSAELLPEFNFDGAEYHILGREYAKLGALPSYEFTVEEESGDVIKDTVYSRNRIIEEQYNVTVTSEQVSSPESAVAKSVQGGDGAYDLVWAHVNNMATLTNQGMLADYYTMPHIDITQPWWNHLATESLTVNGKCYLQMNYIPFSGVMLSHCLYFNKDMAADNGINNLYDLVLNDEWTIDAFTELTKKVSRDADGNGVFDDKDVYGFVCSHGTSGAALSIGMGVVPLKLAEDGTFELTIFSEKNQTILEKLVSLVSEPSTYMITDYAKENDLAKMFAADQALFYSGFLTDSYQFFREMDSDFGLLPFPKFDDTQESYITTVTGGTGLLGIPRVVADAEKTGVITEALAMESLNYVYPAVYETILEKRVLRDPESEQMFRILMDGLAIDFGRTFKYAAYSDLFCDLVAAKSTDLSSAFQKQVPGATKVYKNTIDRYFKD